jgi:hypothetical protein
VLCSARPDALTQYPPPRSNPKQTLKRKAIRLGTTLAWIAYA